MISLSPQTLQQHLHFLYKLKKSSNVTKKKILHRATNEEIRMLVVMVAMVVYRRVDADSEKIVRSKKKKILKKYFKTKRAVQSLLDSPEECRQVLLRLTNILNVITSAYIHES